MNADKEVSGFRIMSDSGPGDAVETKENLV
jgi:hypothetical protein